MILTTTPLFNPDLEMLELIEDYIILIGRNSYLPARFLSDVVTKTVCAFGLTVYDKELFWRLFQFG